MLFHFFVFHSEGLWSRPLSWLKGKISRCRPFHALVLLVDKVLPKTPVFSAIAKQNGAGVTSDTLAVPNVVGPSTAASRTCEHGPCACSLQTDAFSLHVPPPMAGRGTADRLCREHLWFQPSPTNIIQQHVDLLKKNRFPGHS